VRFYFLIAPNITPIVKPMEVGPTVIIPNVVNIIVINGRISVLEFLSLL